MKKIVEERKKKKVKSKKKETVYVARGGARTPCPAPDRSDRGTGRSERPVAILVLRSNSQDEVIFKCSCC
jgi:hypothetical protein